MKRCSGVCDAGHWLPLPNVLLFDDYDSTQLIPMSGLDDFRA